MEKIFRLVFFFLTLHAVAQNPEKARLVSGPVLGSVTATSAIVWIAYRGQGEQIISLIDTAEKTTTHATKLERINNKNGDFALNLTFTGLQPAHVYRVQYALEPLLPHPKCIFQTQSDSAVQDVRFILGSCAYMSPGFARFAFPGPSIKIFYYMKRKRSDFMVWLGDNIYYMFKDYKSFDNMFDRQLKIRKTFFPLSDLLNNQPNYAIWDDHDYGWNDADKSFPLKDTAIKIFKGFWPNDYSTQDTFRGNYFTFRYYDAEFFMTDNRWYLDPEGDTTGSYLGEQQLAWLMEKLKNSNANFKFVCTGSQVVSDSWYDDSYAKYPVERNKLLDFVAEQNIRGVIFLTGDKHFTELSRRDWKGYPFYDFTCSPLTSPVLPTRNIKGFQNSYSITSTILYKKNFGQISLSGPAENRTCKIEVFGAGGQKKWEYLLFGNDLMKK
jgi:alkaline phosphatase D